MPVVSTPVRGHRTAWQQPCRAGIVTPWPVTTAFLLVVMVLVFQIEMHFEAPGESKTLSPITEILLGGLNGTLALSGQWYRLLSHALLHANAGHLIGNAVALALAGYALERIVGHAWMFCIFTMGAVCGGLASLLMLPPSTVGVGASGGIMAVLWALFMTSFRLPSGRTRIRAQANAVFFGLPSIVPHQDSGILHVNYAAHIGGALLGIAVGMLLLTGWDDRSSRPPCLLAAGLLSAVAMLAFGCSAYAVSVNYRVYGPTTRFIPSALVPKGFGDMADHGDGLATRYPMDARSHIYAGMADVARKDRQAQEYEFNRALELNDSTPGFYPPELMNGVHLLLADLLLADGRGSDAIVMARPFCQQPSGTSRIPALAALASKDQLCR